MKTLTIGVDPGATGAIALVNKETKEILSVWDTPSKQVTLTTKKKTNVIDLIGLKEIFDNCISFAFEQSAVLKCNFEKVQGHPKQSPIASFQFGYSTGIVVGLLTAYEIPITFVSPVVWKRAYNLQASEKDTARLLVQHLFPETKNLLKFKKNVDRADAILIAFYGD